MFGCMPPRDVILTVGNEMLEAPMSYRCRWFEYLAYRPLLEKYYEEGPLKDCWLTTSVSNPISLGSSI
jgi:glycine amidinotransferase